MAERTRLREPEARILALRIAASYPNHQTSTTNIKAAVPKLVELTDIDKQPSPTRKHEHKWEQIVGNVVSHQKTSTSIFNKGYAVRTEDGIRVTEKGLDYLKKKGF
ncbi:hypothetical protein [Parvibaculum sp.]|uniref:hypothetical protein n=1 Tax=Parvibaculum sp. TaxID=2024848 RepID=UPI001B04435D|nr:hypothetical protein [Parvibaculum sp.]MBO6667798.1 hypothetical protein [Parvibaculum sp.]MBO6690661.1 hypothetical protein [Parvibaculum sp.]MBO6714966.1 hypothetical protein [Parvibaculum sp.]